MLVGSNLHMVDSHYGTARCCMLVDSNLHMVGSQLRDCKVLHASGQ
jgi:hypothetical protein